MKFLMTTVAVAAMAFVPATAQAQLFGGLDNNTLLGGTVGAGLGGAIGSNLAGSGQRDEGTAIGAALGGLAGAAYANSRSNYYGNPYAGQFNPGFNGRNLAGAGIGAGLGGVIGSNLAGSGVRQEGTAIGAVLGGAAGYALANRGSSRYGGVGPQGGFTPAPQGGFNGGFVGGPGFVPAGPGFVGGPFYGAPAFGAPGLPSAPILSGPQYVPSGQYISGPIMPVTRYIQPPQPQIILSQPRTVFTAPVSQGITYAAPNVRLAGPPIRPTVVRRTIRVEATPIVRAERMMAPPADCPAGTSMQSDGSCLEQSVSFTAPSSSYSYSAPAPVISQPYVAPQMADCPAGTTQQSDGTCMEQSYSAPSYSSSSYSSSSYSAPQMANCPAGTTKQSDGSCLQSSYGSTSSYSSSSSMVTLPDTMVYGGTSSYSAPAPAADCPSGTTMQSDGTCLSSSVTSYAPSYGYSSSATTSYRAPKMHKKHKKHKKMHHMSKSMEEYCYAGGSKRYDSLGNEIKAGKHDHCRNH